MDQYRRIKEKNRGAVLFYRMGDFYEMFDEDAVIASRVLGLTLTSRNHGECAKTPLCGFPFHALDRYLARMIAAGHRVAVCEQVEDPKTAKGLVKRDVIEVVSRGTATNPELLAEKSSNFIASFFMHGSSAGLAAADVSTGEFFCTEAATPKLFTELEKLSPVEILYDESADKAGPLAALKTLLPGAVFTPAEEWRFSVHTAYKDLLAHFGTASLEGFGVEELKAGLAAAGALFSYIREQKKDKVGQIRKISRWHAEKYMALDGATIRNLELVNPLHPEDDKGTLLHVLDRTRTAMGGRLLRRLLVNPLLEAAEIERRLDGVGLFFRETALRENLREALSAVADIERLNGRVGAERANPRDLAALKLSLVKLTAVHALIEEWECPLVDACAAPFTGTGDITGKLAAALVDEPPLSLSEGGVFRKGYSAELDALIEGAREGKEWIASLQQKERERTGIGSLKVGFNQVFGYYIEVSRVNQDKAPADYIRKQTLVNCERFITEDLKKWESVVLTAEEKRIKMETGLFEELRTWLAGHVERLKIIADGAAMLDCLAALAETAAHNNYVRPEINSSDELFIEEGRHPVIENLDFSEQFVPNSLSIRNSGEFIHLITGPNMAGKSTYLRQTGLIALMAQVGSFVPAKSARVGILDRIFTRVGASDRLSRGQSTFLVEMQELANILNNATGKSLILLDEIGRGTSTFDGLSIAWALVEFLHNNSKVAAKTLFATHYHELTDLPLLLKGVKNRNIAVKEWNDKIIFLRKIVDGACDHSYGIQVARLAGVPEPIILRAKEVLANLEAAELTADHKPALARTTNRKETKRQDAAVSQLTLFDSSLHMDVLELIRGIDLNTLTPLEALNKLAEIKKKIKE